MIDLYPKVCNLCGGEVTLVPNKTIYGKSYGSGKCYLCSNCKAYVGTHKPRPKEALGILANKEMRQAKMQCHHIFDSLWETQGQREALYKKLAEELNIPRSECHFGYFDLDMLQKAYGILIKWKLSTKERLFYRESDE